MAKSVGTYVGALMITVLLVAGDLQPAKGLQAFTALLAAVLALIGLLSLATWRQRHAER
jgi:hypothetical protein